MFIFGKPPVFYHIRNEASRLVKSEDPGEYLFHFRRLSFAHCIRKKDLELTPKVKRLLKLEALAQRLSIELSSEGTVPVSLARKVISQHINELRKDSLFSKFLDVAHSGEPDSPKNIEEHVSSMKEQAKSLKNYKISSVKIENKILLSILRITHSQLSFHYGPDNFDAILKLLKSEHKKLKNFDKQQERLNSFSTKPENN